MLESHCTVAAVTPADGAPARVRNLCQYNALDACDLAVTDSLWQKAQYPACLAEKIAVLAPGVDSGYFSPYPGLRFTGEACDPPRAACPSSWTTCPPF